VLWFQDETGSEAGRWVVQPVAGGGTTPFLEGVPHGWSEGLAQAPGIVAAGISDSSGFGIYVSLDGGPSREIHRSSEAVRIGSAGEGGFLLGGLSADGALLCVEHSEHGDLMHPHCVCSIHAPERRSVSSSTKDCHSRHGAGRPCRATSCSPSTTSATATNGLRCGI
jgi:hypothetical protein